MTSPDASLQGDRPDVTILMANYNGAPHIAAAVRSALRQTLAALEVVIVDDASTDDGLSIARRLAEEDPRVRVFAQPRNGGPGAARNRGLDEARGRWIAVLDSDDMMHPGRIEALMAEAEATGADIIADDLLVFYEAGDRAPHRFLKGRVSHQAGFVDVADYVASGALYTPASKLGFLKPVFRAEALRGLSLRYDESLKIGEDADLVTRAMMGGLRLRVSPFPGYVYRKHDASISHTMRVSHVEALLASADRLAPLASDAKLKRAFAHLRVSFLKAQAYGRAIDALRERRVKDAVRDVLREPRSLELFRMPVEARIGRLKARLTPPRRTVQAGPRPIVLLSRQRLIGSTNGSSTYLLALCRGLKAAGHTIHLLQPSPVVFGRWPFLTLKPEMDIFASHAIRGGLRIGRTIFCVRPWVWIEAGRGVAAQLLAKARLPHAFLGAKRAPYNIAAPWSAEDFVFTAANTPAGGCDVLTDYGFQNVLLPYTLHQKTTAVVMHDLFFRRTDQFTAKGAEDSVATLTEAQEMRLLGLADVVVAIQYEEAAYITPRIPQSRVVTVPMGVDAVEQAYPGQGRELLFVGSNTAPNVIGLKWFFDEVWPAIRQGAPDVALTVAGNIARAFPDGGPEGVSFLGMVDDLGPLYARAAVVVSPLTVGSGLKIKLIEAMAAGKALVATPVTLQGVESLVEGAVARADTPEAFAQETLALLGDPQRRAQLAARALATANDHFGVEAACRPLVEAFGAGQHSTHRDR